MLKIFISISLLLLMYGIQNEECVEMKSRSQSNIPMEAITIVYVGKDVTVECHSCDVNHMQWTYKPRNRRTQEEIIKRNKTIRNNNHGNIGQFGLLYNSSCTYNLLLTKIQFGAAGVYSCWDNTLELRIRNIIVISEDSKCFIEEFSDSENIFLKQNDSVAINCSFQYSADESCIVTPIWTDLMGHRDLMISDDDFEIDMGNNHAWFHFRRIAELRKGIHFNLSFVFNCSSFKNNSHDKHIQAKYNFGHAPFTIALGGTRREFPEKVSNAFNPRLTIWILITAVIIVYLTVSLLLMFLKHHSKLCFASNHERAKDENIVLEKAVSDDPVDTGYIRINEELQSEDVRIYEVIDDDTYDAIVEQSEELT